MSLEIVILKLMKNIHILDNIKCLPFKIIINVRRMNRKTKINDQVEYIPTWPVIITFRGTCLPMEMDSKSAPSDVIYQSYRTRWLILLLFSLNSMLNGSFWFYYTDIPNIIKVINN